MSAYPFVSRAEFARIKARARKERLAQKRQATSDLSLAAANAVGGARHGNDPDCGNGHAADLRGLKSNPRACSPKIPTKRKRRKPSARKSAFLRLKELCRTFVMLRAKHRTGGFCEVAMQCAGRGPIEVPYHVTPQAMGNALKYDERNLLGSCSSCNGSEYFARKRGASIYRERHAAILGPVFAELEATAGRKQISTAEAVEMADKFKARIEAGEWRK